MCASQFARTVLDLIRFYDRCVYFSIRSPPSVQPKNELCNHRGLWLCVQAPLKYGGIYIDMDHVSSRNPAKLETIKHIMNDLPSSTKT